MRAVHAGVRGLNSGRGWGGARPPANEFAGWKRPNMLKHVGGRAEPASAGFLGRAGADFNLRAGGRRGSGRCARRTLPLYQKSYGFSIHLPKV